MAFGLLVLAVLGFLGGARLAGRAAFGLLRRGVEVYLTTEVEASLARRGDLTALQESGLAQRTARRGRAAAALTFAGTVALLIVPAFTPWTRELYALYAPLWFLGRRPRA